MNTREAFPQLNTKLNDHPLIYADFASTALKPQSVIDAVTAHYTSSIANPGRGISTLANTNEQRITEVRAKVKAFVGAPEDYSVIFTKNATEAVNLVAFSMAQEKQKFSVITTEAEHHANLLPWLRLRDEDMIRQLKLLPITEDGRIDLNSLTTSGNQSSPILLAITHCSNVIGNITDLTEISTFSRAPDHFTLLDATQSFPHIRIDLRETPVDFLVASAHKAYGPEGVGVLVVSSRALPLLKPLLLGGGIVEAVTKDDYTLKSDISLFEAGTPHTAGIIGFGAALDFLSQLGADHFIESEQILHAHIAEHILHAAEFTFLPWGAEPSRHIPLFSFYHTTIHAHDIADFLDKRGITVRAGYHCAEPIHRALNVPPTVRLSFSFVNTTSEIDTIFAILKECHQKYA